MLMESMADSGEAREEGASMSSIFSRIQRAVRKRHMILWISFCMVILGLGLGYISVTLCGMSSPQVVPYSELVEHLQSKTVTTALFEEGSNNLYFNLGQSEENHELLSKWAYKTRRVKNDEAFLLQLMRDGGGKYSCEPETMSKNLIFFLFRYLIHMTLFLLPLILPIPVLLLMYGSPKYSSDTCGRGSPSTPVVAGIPAGIQAGWLRQCRYCQLVSEAAGIQFGWLRQCRNCRLVSD